ncbi:hypothetical protein ACWCOV_09965 [Kribbella sp. NPDC002412]
MLSREEDIDAHSLRRRGWTISAIARHLKRDRKTIRAIWTASGLPASAVRRGRTCSSRTSTTSVHG